MAEHLRKNTSSERAAHICYEVSAGLDADPKTQDLASLWVNLATKGDTLAAQGQALYRALLRARAFVTVRDALWDTEVSAFARASLDASGGKYDELPNTRFFGNVTASAVQKFGIDREVAQGQAWVAELGRDPGEALAVAWAPRLNVATSQLDQSANDRKAALSAVAMHEVGEMLYVEEINVEVDKLEGELKKRFPRQPKRVAAYLAPFQSKRAAKGEEAAPEEPAGESDT